DDRAQAAPCKPVDIVGGRLCRAPSVVAEAMLVDVHQSKHAVIEHKHVEVTGHPPEQRPSPGGRSFAKLPTPDLLDTLQPRKPPPSEPRDARSVDAPTESDHAIFSARPLQDGIGRSLASAREDGFNPQSSILNPQSSIQDMRDRRMRTNPRIGARSRIYL